MLDTLASSSSLTSTVVSQLQLRAISYVGVGLIAIWILSPVGGQASFRQISYGPTDIPEHTEFLYVVPSQWLMPPDYTGVKVIMEISYLAALTSPTTAQGSPRDTWGHIKVPRIEHYEGTFPPGDEGWYGTENGTQESYSSFIGVPIGGTDLPEFIDYSTTIQAQYFHLTCDPYVGDPDVGEPQGSYELESQFTFNSRRFLGHVYWNENVTKRAEIPPGEVDPFAFVITAPSSTSTQDWNCTIETTYVEAEIACSTHDACAAVRIRRSRLAHPPAAYTQLGPLIGFRNTPWESALFNMAVAAGTVDNFHGDDESASSDGSAELGKVVLSQRYLDGSKNILGIASDVAEGALIIYLSQILNANWATMNGKSSLMGSFDASTNRSNANVSWYYQGQDDNQTMDLKFQDDFTLSDRSHTNFSSYYQDQDDIQNMDSEALNDALLLAGTWPSTGTRRSNVENFHAHFGWVIALIVSSTVLIVASLVPFYLRTFLPHGPDVLMNFSSLAARDNPYVAIPGTGTYLDATDRSRLLKDVRIRFGDVEEGGEIGRLAIGRADGDVAPLGKGRKYA